MDKLANIPPTVAAQPAARSTAVAAPQPATPAPDRLASGVASAHIHEGLRGVAGADPILARDVKTTDDYTRFVGQLETKYPDASGLDINRAVRQHFYSERGVKNSSEVFDSWLGTEGGQNSPALKGVDRDLEGLPSRIDNPKGKPVDLSHLSVGVDAYYNHKTGRHGVIQAPLDAAKGVMLTHGGDMGQVFGASLMAIGNKLGISKGTETFSGALDYASMPELRGNQDGIEIGMRMGRDDRLSTVLAKHYH